MTHTDKAVQGFSDNGVRNVRRTEEEVNHVEQRKEKKKRKKKNPKPLSTITNNSRSRTRSTTPLGGVSDPGSVVSTATT